MMKYWEVSYYKTRNWIHTKYIKSASAQDAIKKARVKHIVDLQEMTKEEYLKEMTKEEYLKEVER